MTNTMAAAAKVLSVFALIASAFAQTHLVSTPSPAAAGPAYDLSVGYSNLMMAVPSGGHANLNGVDASGSVALTRRWGATVDSSFLRASDIAGTPHQAYVLTSQVGPVFYPFEHRNTRALIRGLVGAGLVDSASLTSRTEYFHGWLLRPAYTFGGGVEHALSPRFSVRVVADYLRTSSYDGTGAVQPQNSLRFTASFGFRLRQHPH